MNEATKTEAHTHFAPITNYSQAKKLAVKHFGGNALVKERGGKVFIGVQLANSVEFYGRGNTYNEAFEDAVVNGEIEIEGHTHEGV